MSVVEPATLLFATAAATAVFGTLVAALAYRGSRRNDSETMFWLSVGVVCIAVLPFGVNYALGPMADLSDAATLLGVLVSYNAGLLAIIYSLESA